MVHLPVMAGRVPASHVVEDRGVGQRRVDTRITSEHGDLLVIA
jgi:hypothetical protein